MHPDLIQKHAHKGPYIKNAPIYHFHEIYTGFSIHMVLRKDPKELHE